MTALPTSSPSVDASLESLSDELHRTQAALTRAMFALAKRGDAPAVAMCLDAGVAVDVLNAEGNTALGVALHHWKYPVATLLLERGAYPNAPMHGEARFVHRAILGNERYVNERCPELIVAYQLALAHLRGQAFDHTIPDA